jgi:uncharacterized protein (TIGR02996 family)
MATTRSRVATNLARQVNEATSALGRGDGEAAITALVDAWGKARLPRLAAGIRALTALLDVPPIEVTGDQQRTYLAWAERAAARRAADVGPLVTAFLEAEENPKAMHHVRTARLKLLATFAPDPRVDALCDRLDRCWNGRLFGSTLFGRVVLRHLDPHQPHGPLVEEAQKVAPREGLELEVADALDELDRALAASGRLVVGLPVQSAPGADSAEALLAAVYANPADDALKQVYADRLAETEDPRGEFISLQFLHATGTATKEQQAREAALLKRHLAAWLGPLATHVVKAQAQFEKGFPVRLHANASRIFQAREALELEEWATVREIDFAKTAYFGRTMRSLRVARSVSAFGLTTLAELEAPPPLEELELWPGAEFTRPAPAQWTWPATLRRLSGLVDLSVVLPYGCHADPVEVLDALVAQLPPAVTKLTMGGLDRERLDLPTLSARRPAQLRELWVNGAKVR